MTACQAIEFRRPLKSSEILEYAHDRIRAAVDFAEEDRIFADDIVKIKEELSNYSFVSAVHDHAKIVGIDLNQDFVQF